MEIEQLKQISCFLLDLDGTVYLGGELLPGARDFLDGLDVQQIPFYFVTNNSSRSRREYQEKLKHLGLEYGEERVVTSGEATALYIKNRKPQARLFVVGTPSLEKEFVDHGFTLNETDPEYVVLGFDTTLTYQKIWKLCDLLREGRPYIATHPDLNCPTPSGFMPDVGSMIAMVAASTGRQPDVIIGKPHAPIVEAIEAKTGLSATQLAMVGDRLYTDIALGQAGIIAILVLSGETRREDLAGSPFTPDFVFENLQELHLALQSLK